MSTIHAETRSIRQLLSNTKYTIDFYQREYEWGRKNIEELLDDLESKFSPSFDITHSRDKVQQYPHYFLGTIITVNENNQKYIIDGQQRLTTLTLILISLHHLKSQQEGIADVRPMIFSEQYGVKSFNLNVPERVDCMRALFETGFFDSTNYPDLSVRNLVDRYTDIVELFPENLQGEPLPYFVDWLIDNVDLVEIKTYSDDDAFTIFETMNDRGVNLGPTDMLKGYLLANINGYDDDAVHNSKTQASKIWKQHILKLTAIEPEEDVAFFKTWLRAKYAETIRERKKGAVNRDFENINKFHRWVRDEKQRIGLNGTNEFYDFITHSMDRYANHYIQMREASFKLTNTLETFYYNAYNDFTLQYMLALAPIRLEDESAIANRKMRLVSTYIDIYIARRMVNFRTLSYSSIVYTMFNLMKEIRNLDTDNLAETLWNKLEEMPETFDGVKDFYLHQQNYSRMKYLLTRITTYIEQMSGVNTTFDTYAQRDMSKPFEIEHIWANRYERYATEFSNITEFERYRNRMGGLILLPRGTNQSFGDIPYEEKLQHYYGENLLAKSLHLHSYKKNPNFLNYVEKSNLPFSPYEQFGKEQFDARQELYRLICEEIWNPKRLEEEYSK